MTPGTTSRGKCPATRGTAFVFGRNTLLEYYIVKTEPSGVV